MPTFDDIQALFARTEKPDAAAVWQADWRCSEPSFARSAPAFFHPPRLAQACDKVGIAGEMKAAVLQAAQVLPGHPALFRLAWHCHYMLFLSGKDQVELAWHWPTLPAELGPVGDLFYALVCLSGLPVLRRQHAALGIEEAVTHRTLSDVAIWLRDQSRDAGRWRWRFDRISWLVLHCQSKLFGLGRLQFEMGHVRRPFEVYRHKTTGRVVVLAEEGLTFRGDGQFLDANGPAAAPVWTTTLVRRKGTLQGTAISPWGRALPEPVTLPTDQYQRVLKPGDPALLYHIPADGPMDHAACGQAFAQAVTFFDRHFPNLKAKAFYTESWLLDPQLEAHLPAASNIVRFLREFYLLPTPEANDGQTIERVFGQRPDDWAAAPRDTTLRRAVIDHVRAGGVWRGGGGLLLPQDLAWGRQVYRAMHPQRALSAGVTA